jgi:hypothetical protein
MFTRPASQNLAMEQSLYHLHMYNKVGDIRGTIQVVPFFEKTQSSWDGHNGSREGAYFLPFGKEQILIAGADSGVTLLSMYELSGWDYQQIFLAIFHSILNKNKLAFYLSITKTLAALFTINFSNLYGVALRCQ